MRRDDPTAPVPFRLSLEPLEDRAVPANVGIADANFVDQLYRDILHRAPDVVGLTNWTTALLGGKSRGFVVDSILNSDEGRGVQVNDLYLRFLGRPADAGGLTAWSNYLRDHDNIDLAAQIIGSDEYFQTQGGGTNAGFLNAVYGDVLCRSITTDEMRDRNDDFSRGVGSRFDIAEGILNSGEAEDLRDQHSVLSYLRQNVSSDQAEDIVSNANSSGNFDNDDAVFSGTLLSSRQYYAFAQTAAPTDFATIPSCDNINATTGLPTTTTTTTII